MERIGARFDWSAVNTSPVAPTVAPTIAPALLVNRAGEAVRLGSIESTGGQSEGGQSVRGRAGRLYYCSRWSSSLSTSTTLAQY